MQATVAAQVVCRGFGPLIDWWFADPHVSALRPAASLRVPTRSGRVAHCRDYEAGMDHRRAHGCAQAAGRAGVDGNCPLKSRPDEDLHHEAYLPTEQPTPEAQARLPLPHADLGGAQPHSPPSVEGTEAAVRVDSLLRADVAFAGVPPVRGALVNLVEPVRAVPPAPVDPVPPVRLRSSQAIRAVFSEGVRGHGPSMVVHARQRDCAQADPPRIAVVAGRKVGGAVQRNRAKRRLRAAICGVGIPQGLDIVVVARPDALSVPFSALCAEFTRSLQRVVAQSVRRG